MTLAVDDLLVIFTDGMTDATALDGTEFGEERLIEVISAHHADGARCVLQQIIDDVRAHSGPEQFDDLTLIVGKAV